MTGSIPPLKTRMGKLPRRDRDVVDRLAEEAGPDRLVGLNFYASLTLDRGPELFTLEAYDPETKFFRVRPADAEGVFTQRAKLSDLEIGIGRRDLDDPLLELLGKHGLPTHPFLRAHGPEKTRRSPPRNFGSQSRNMRRDPMGVQGETPSVRGRSPARSARTRPRRAHSSTSSGWSDNPRGRNRNGRHESPGRKRRERSVSSSEESEDTHVDFSRRSLAKKLHVLMRDRRVWGEQGELRRLEAEIPAERKGLRAQFSLLEIIHTSPESWAKALSLAGCHATLLKSVDLKYEFMANSHLVDVRQMCEDRGTHLTAKQEDKICGGAWTSYGNYVRKQKSCKRSPVGAIGEGEEPGT